VGRTHQYEVSTVWQGNRGEGTTSYRSYERLYYTVSRGRPAIEGSSDPVFRGDPERWNPELLLVAALSQCHMLSYLHRCAIGGVVVTEYTDTATGVMRENDDDGGRFEEVVLHPIVTVAEASMVDRALQLHTEASKRCFIASSVNFPVRHDPRIVAGDTLVA
jgi:organic hydroperoxide reductase OsmC/OhrA